MELVVIKAALHFSIFDFFTFSREALSFVIVNKRRTNEHRIYIYIYIYILYMRPNTLEGIEKKIKCYPLWLLLSLSENILKNYQLRRIHLIAGVCKSQTKDCARARAL